MAILKYFAETGNPNTDRDRMAGTLADKMLLDRFAQALCQNCRRRDIRFRQNHNELFPAVARGHVKVAQRFANAVRRLAQHIVTGLMPEGVVEGFEAVNIHHHEGEGELIAF